MRINNDKWNEQRLLQEKWFQQSVKKLIDIMKATNSFQTNSGYFVNFGGRAATDERAVISIKSLERITVKNSIISSAVMLLKLWNSRKICCLFKQGETKNRKQKKKNDGSLKFRKSSDLVQDIVGKLEERCVPPHFNWKSFDEAALVDM